MREYAKDVEYAITCVALASDKDDAGNIIFPEKKDVIETLAGASCKLNELVAHIFSQIWGKSLRNVNLRLFLYFMHLLFLFFCSFAPIIILITRESV